jgi:hypothetical protein
MFPAPALKSVADARAITKKDMKLEKSMPIFGRDFNSAVELSDMVQSPKRLSFGSFLENKRSELILEK